MTTTYLSCMGGQAELVGWKICPLYQMMAALPTFNCGAARGGIPAGGI